MFTDIAAAIEEARWLRRETYCHHVVVQKRNGYLIVRQEAGESRELLLRQAYSSRYDCHKHTVLPEVR